MKKREKIIAKDSMHTLRSVSYETDEFPPSFFAASAADELKNWLDDIAVYFEERGWPPPTEEVHIGPDARWTLIEPGTAIPEGWKKDYGYKYALADAEPLSLDYFQARIAANIYSAIRDLDRINRALRTIDVANADGCFRVCIELGELREQLRSRQAHLPKVRSRENSTKGLVKARKKRAINKKWDADTEWRDDAKQIATEMKRKRPGLKKSEVARSVISRMREEYPSFEMSERHVIRVIFE